MTDDPTNRYVTIYGKRYRVCVYLGGSGAWGTFAESRKFYLGATSRSTPRRAWLAGLRIALADAMKGAR